MIIFYWFCVFMSTIGIALVDHSFKNVAPIKRLITYLLICLIPIINTAFALITFLYLITGR